VGGLQDGENLVIEAPQVLAAFIITGFGESVQSIGSQDLAKRGTSPTHKFKTWISLRVVQSNFYSWDFPKMN